MKQKPLGQEYRGLCIVYFEVLVGDKFSKFGQSTQQYSRLAAYSFMPIMTHHTIQERKKKEFKEAYTYFLFNSYELRIILKKLDNK